MKKPAVIIDIDDTIADTSTFFIEWINARSQRQYIFSELDQTYRNGHQPDYQMHLKQILAQPELAMSIAPYKDSLKSIKQLSDYGFEVHIVTARNNTFREVTKRWFDHHGFSTYITQIHTKPHNQPDLVFKRELADTLQPLAAFDDTLNVGLVIVAAGVYVYLIDRPWNTGELLPTAMERVPSFGAGVSKFLQRASRI